MSNIERSTHPTPCSRCPLRAEIEEERDAAIRDAAAHHAASRELAKQLQGAVEALREIHDLAETPGADADDLLGAISVKTAEAIRTLGGQ